MRKKKMFCPGCNRMAISKKVRAGAIYIPADGGFPILYLVCNKCALDLRNPLKRGALIEDIESALEAGRRPVQ
jgi:RNase P subunit RPR2